MNEPKRSPSGEPIRWIDPSADAVRRPTLSALGAIRGRRQHVLTFRIQPPLGSWSIYSTVGGAVSVDSRRVGEVSYFFPDVGSNLVDVDVLLDPGIEPGALAGAELRFDLVHRVVTEDRVPVTVRVDVTPPP